MLNNNSRVVTGRGGSGNFRAAPLKLDIVGSYPITAHILAQHEAANLEYESEVIKRHKEAKANKPTVSGRGGIGNITESNPRSPKPLRRASFFKGGGAEIQSLSTSPTDRLDMNAFDEDERRKYAHAHGRELRHMSTPSTVTSPVLCTYPEYPQSDRATTGSCNESIHTQSSGSSASTGTSPTSPTSRERYIISKLWRKSASKSDSQPGE